MLWTHLGLHYGLRENYGVNLHKFVLDSQPVTFSLYLFFSRTIDILNNYKKMIQRNK